MKSLLAREGGERMSEREEKRAENREEGKEKVAREHKWRKKRQQVLTQLFQLSRNAKDQWTGQLTQPVGSAET